MGVTYSPTLYGLNRVKLKSIKFTERKKKCVKTDLSVPTEDQDDEMMICNECVYKHTRHSTKYQSEMDIKTTEKMKTL